MSALSLKASSNAGKITLAERICEAVPGSAAVHTDDIAWEHSRFGWSDLLADGGRLTLAVVLDKAFGDFLVLDALRRTDGAGVRSRHRGHASTSLR
jgi:hypothetical protein